MPSAEERQATHLENIGNYLYDLVQVMTAINQNLADFAKIVKESAEGPSPAWAKEQDPKPCPECRLMFCEMEDCGNKKEEKNDGTEEHTLPSGYRCTVQGTHPASECKYEKEGE